MAQKPLNKKLIVVIAALLIGGIAFFGYTKQTGVMSDADNKGPATIDSSLLKARPNDIIVGDNNALVTIVEYSSLTCPHCAHFHADVLPAIKKEYIDSGKVKLIMRHFPLNEPAVKASQLVECVGAQGGQRTNFLKALFETQDKWAFAETYLADLKKIALVGGVDSAAFDSCMANKDLETKILNSRREAAEKLGVNATPSFFIDGVKLEKDYSVESFRTALDAAGK
ncbi:MAG: DsbA family protein [Rickettsiales bacterium]